MRRTNKLPLISIITPAYNRASYIEETILSILDQDYPYIEYIVLDDGSKDNTLDIIKKFEGRIKWESHKNMGETRTVNKGFSICRGEIVGIVNSDDPLLPGAISSIVGFMLRRPDLLVVYPDWIMIDQNGNKIQNITTYEYSYSNMLRWHHCMPGPGTLFRHEIIKKLEGRDPNFRYVGDFDFWLRAGLLGPFARIPSTLATFRFHEDSASVNQQGTLMAEEHIQLMNKIYSLPNLPRDVLKVKNEAYSSSNYIAGVVLGPNSSSEKKKYFIKALILSPFKYRGEYRHRLPIILPELMGFLYHPSQLIYLLLFKPKLFFSKLERKIINAKSKRDHSISQPD